MNGHNKGNHYKMYRFDERLLLTLLTGWQRMDTIVLPTIKNLPDGWEIHGVEHSFTYRDFVFLVWHPSFPLLPDGSMTPMADVGLKVECVHLRKSSLPLPRTASVEDIKGQIEFLQEELRLKEAGSK